MQTHSTDIIKGISYNYRFVGHGAQFRVYAIDARDGMPTGRVIKVPRTFEEIEQAVTPYVDVTGSLVEQAGFIAAQMLMVRRQEIPKIISGVNGENAELMEAVGDLRVVSKTFQQINDKTGETILPVFCTQDEVVPLVAFLERFRFSEQYPERLTPEHISQIEYIFGKLCELQLLLWAYGFFELSFNLRNFGVKFTGNQVTRIILLDVGEMIMDGHAAKTRLELRPWLYNVNHLKRDYAFLPPVLHTLFVRICEETLTTKAFHEHWKRQKRYIETQHRDYLQRQELLAENATERVYLWVKQQTVTQRLYRGMSQSRIEADAPDIEDLRLLQSDTRLWDISSDSQAERAERRQAGTMWQPDSFLL